MTPKYGVNLETISEGGKKFEYSKIRNFTQVTLFNWTLPRKRGKLGEI